MEHYIPKNVLIAEIERRKKELTELSNDFVNQWACASLDNILSFINTLETKEQRELLFQKMKEAGYEWDAKLKQLRKIEQKHEENLRK